MEMKADGERGEAGDDGLIHLVITRTGKVKLTGEE